MNDKSELLNQLTIDRSAATPGGLSIGSVLVIAVLAAILGGVGAVWWFTPNVVDATQGVNGTVESKTGGETTASKALASTDKNSGSSSSSPAATDASQQILNASGYITARRIATVSSEITGLITAVNVEEGMVVEEGHILAKLDDAVASVNLRLAKSQLNAQRSQTKSIEANLAEARRVYQRARELRTKNLTSEANVTATSAQAESLQAQLDSALALITVSEIEVLRQNEHLLKHTIRAPFAGVVTVKNAQPGEIVSPGSAGGGFTRTGICTIVDMSSLEIEVDVSESFIGRVFAGQKVEANLDAYPAWNIPASVIAIIPTADRAKATVKVRIGIDQADDRILPDMGIKVAFLKT